MQNQRSPIETKNTASKDYLVYVLPFTENLTERKNSILQELYAKGGIEVNAVVLFPKDNTSSSTGSCRYKAWIIRNGCWVTIESVADNAVELLQDYPLQAGFLTKNSSDYYYQLIHEAIFTADIDGIQVPSDVTFHLVANVSTGIAQKRVKETLESVTAKDKEYAASLAKEEAEQASHAAAVQGYAKDIRAMEEKKPEAAPHTPHKLILKLDQEIIKAANAKNTFVFFNRVPKVILEKYLLPFLHLTKDKKTTRQLGFALVPSKSSTLFLEHSHPQVEALLQAVVYAQYDKVKKILDDAAQKSLLLLEKLLTIPMEIVDYSGRHLYGNALQLALGAGDVSRSQYPNEGMAELIMGNYKQLPNGESLKQAHIDEFAKHAEISPEQNAKDINVVEKVFQDIADAKTSDEEEKALQVLRDYLKLDPNELITGKHFNHNMLIKAYELYEKYYVQFGGWDSPKNNLAWRNVIGYLQRFLPACDAQVMAQGLWGVAENGDPLRRSLEFRYDRGVFVFPLPVGASGLGYEYAGGALARPAAGGGRARCPTRLYETYVNQKRVLSQMTLIC